MAKIIRFPATDSELAKPLAEYLKEFAQTPKDGENIVPFEVPNPTSLRGQNMWRSKYQGITIALNPYAFDTEEEYLACFDALAEVMFEFDQL